jgi:hypothetical protein
MVMNQQILVAHLVLLLHLHLNDEQDYDLVENYHANNYHGYFVDDNYCYLVVVDQIENYYLVDWLLLMVLLLVDEQHLIVEKLMVELQMILDHHVEQMLKLN